MPETSGSRPRVGGILLAAGGSRRLGRPKQTLPFGTSTLVHTAAEHLVATCAAVAVIVGAAAGEVREALRDLPLAILENDRWEEGMASSIRAGVAHAVASDWQAVLIAVCDQPRLSRAHLRALIAAHTARPCIAASRYAAALGTPAVFGRDAFPALLALKGDRGAGPLLRGATDITPIDWPEGAWDVDTPENAADLVASRAATSRGISTPRNGEGAAS